MNSSKWRDTESSRYSCTCVKRIKLLIFMLVQNFSHEIPNLSMTFPWPQRRKWTDDYDNYFTREFIRSTPRFFGPDPESTALPWPTLNNLRSHSEKWAHFPDMTRMVHTSLLQCTCSTLKHSCQNVSEQLNNSSGLVEKISISFVS
jgi:hypothetical protein